MTPSIDERSAARILELAEQPTGSRSRAAASFCLILALAAHGASVGGSLAPAQTAAMSPAGAGPIPRESDHMKRLMAIGAAAAVASGAAAQDAVQWRVEDGGNGHWYLTAPGSGGCWSDHRMWSEQVGGHLATLTTAAEDAFVESLCTTQFLNIGGFQKFDACEPGCGWNWVTGEPWGHARWDSGQPEDFYGGQFGGQDLLSRTSTGWHDASDCLPYTGDGYIIEWSADCNSDGLVDFGQIRAGELADANANNIPDCCEAGVDCDPCLADISGNGTVDGVDLAAVLNSWGNAPTGKSNADVNGDGVVDGADLAEVLNAWGACP